MELIINEKLGISCDINKKKKEYRFFDVTGKEIYAYLDADYAEDAEADIQRLNIMSTAEELKVWFICNGCGCEILSPEEAASAAATEEVFGVTEFYAFNGFSLRVDF